MMNILKIMKREKSPEYTQKPLDVPSTANMERIEQTKKKLN